MIAKEDQLEESRQCNAHADAGSKAEWICAKTACGGSQEFDPIWGMFTYLIHHYSNLENTKFTNLIQLMSNIIIRYIEIRRCYLYWHSVPLYRSSGHVTSLACQRSTHIARLW
jgi:hypothetical protein